MRVQLALNVTDIDEAFEFYSKLFDTLPYRVEPGYANWVIENPPLKLVLFENRDPEPGSINQLGVEAETADEVESNEARFRAAGLSTTGIDDTVCCFAERGERRVGSLFLLRRGRAFRLGRSSRRGLRCWLRVFAIADR